MQEDCEALRNVSFRPGYHPVPSNRPYGVQIQTVMFIVWNSLLGVFVLMFLFFKYLHPYRKRFSRLHERPTELVILPCIGASLLTLVGSYYQSHELEDGLPCWVFLSAYFTVIPLLVFPLAVRLFSLYRQAQWTVAIIDVTKRVGGGHEQQGGEEPEPVSATPGSEAVSVTGSGTNANGDRGSFCKSFMRIMFCMDRRRTRNKFESGVVSPGAERQSNVNVETSSAIGANKPMQLIPRTHATEIRIMKFLKSDLGSSAVLTTIFLPYILTVAISLGITPMVVNGCYGCAPTKTEEAFLIVGAVFALLLLIIAYRVNLNRKDPFGIVQEARLTVFCGGLPACIFLVCNTVFKPYTQADFQFIMLVELFVVIFVFNQTALQCILALNDVRSESSAMAQVAYSIKEFERDFVRKDGRFHDAFSRHLASEHGYESMAFLLSVIQWEKEYFDVNSKTARARAKKIMNMYVGNDAELPCNLSSNCVHLMDTYLHRQDEDLKYDFFGLAKSELIKMLYGDSFRRFVKSREYRNVEAMTSKEMVSAKV